MSEEQRRKDTCRSYAHVYLRRGKLVRKDCASCGSGETQMHHPDYSRPLHVVWLCRPCHLELHASEKQIAPRGAFSAGLARRRLLVPSDG